MTRRNLLERHVVKTSRLPNYWARSMQQAENRFIIGATVQPQTLQFVDVTSTLSSDTGRDEHG